MSIDTRNSAIFRTPFIDINVTPQAKRAEQLRRWEESATSKEGTTPKDNNRRIMFSDPCVFLAACSAGEKEEAKRLLDKGVDINTANTDGITALHQACIDDDLDMVEFLVQNGADLNRGDNEGWTPLHATSSCGVLSIAKYLIDQGADVAAVNNEGELPMDLCISPETDDVSDMLRREINIRGIDCEEARTMEENRLLLDAQQWINAGQIMEQPHPKTGATGLHVAAAKGYIRAMQLLLRCGADINAQDYDGWTPLHAAGYWAQREACELLAENLCNMDIKNYRGLTAFDVADDEVLTLLERLKNKQAVLARERPEVAEIISRRPQPTYRRRSSVTRMSASERASQVSRDASSEMERLRDLRIEDEQADHPSRPADADQVELRKKANQPQPAPARPQRPSSQPAPPAFSPRPPDGSAETESPSWRRPAAAQRLSAPDDTRSNKQREESSRTAEPADSRRVQSAPPPPAAPPSEQTVSATIIQSPPASPVAPGAPPAVGRSGVVSTPDGPPVPPARASQTAAQSPAPTANQGRVQVDQQPAAPASNKLSPATIFKNIFKSFVPPVREEESETQRKAHAKRVRETRRSTQGVTLEDIKSAEQYVKNQQQQQQQQQQEHQQKGQQQQQTAAAPAAPPAAAAAAAPLAREEDLQQQVERRPSWRLRLDEGDKNKFSLEEVRGGGDATRGSGRTSAGPPPPNSPEADATVTLPLRRKSNSADTAAGAAAAQNAAAGSQPPADDKGDDKENDSRTAVATQAAIQRRRKPKRRSTGVVQFDVEENEKKAGRDGDSADPSTALSNQSNANASSECSSRTASRANSVENGEVDYKKLYEAAMVENEKLQHRLAEAQADCRDAKLNLDKALQMSSSRAAAAESDRREKRAMERRISEMEEELQAMEELRAVNQRLRGENGALIRVISKLSK